MKIFRKVHLASRPNDELQQQGLHFLFFPVVNISFSDYILTCFQKNTQANDFEDISEIIKALNISTDDFAIRTTRFWKINFAPGSSR